MAVSFANLTSGQTSGVSSVATASITLAADRLGLLTVSSLTFDPVIPNVPTCSGWTEVVTRQFNGPANERRRVTTLRRMSASPATGTHTIDFAGQSQAGGIIWSVEESGADIDLTGTNGSGAVVQSVAGAALGPVTTFDVTLAAFASASNGTFGACGLGYNVGSMTVGSGFTSLAEVNDTGFQDISQLTQWRADNDTSVDCTTANAAYGAMLALEIAVPTGVVLTGTFGQFDPELRLAAWF